MWIKRKIGSLYLGLNPVNGPVKWHVFVFLMRRIFFVTILYSLSSLPYFQMSAFIVASLLYLTYLNYMAYYDDNLSLYLENFNEGLFFVICYIFILYCNLVFDQEIKNELGKYIIGIVLVIIGINGFFMVRYMVI